MKEVRGSVSIVLALSFTLILSFGMVLIESARENTMLLKAKVIFDVGMQSILAEYHQRLWEDYDLLFVDTGYGSAQPDYESVKGHMSGYIEKNLELDRYGWLALEFDTAQMSRVTLATDYDGIEFFKQAVDAAQESVGITYIEQILRWFKQTELSEYMEATLEQDKQNLDRKFEEVNGMEVEVKEAVWGTDKQGNSILIEEAEYETVEIKNPLDNIQPMNLLLWQVFGENAEISNESVYTKNLLSQRTLAVGDGVQDTENKNIIEDLWNKGFFCKYIMDHFPSYIDKMVYFEENILQYQLEYILCGKSSDRANLEGALARILIIREIDNYLLLLQDDIRRLEAEAIGNATAASAMVPWLGPVVTHALLLCWAYEDSIADLKQLVQGGEVPLVKSIELGGTQGFRLNYEEYLVLLLLMQWQEKQTARVMDMIEMVIRGSEPYFRMDGCISSAVLSGTFTDVYEKQYTVSQKLQYY